MIRLKKLIFLVVILCGMACFGVLWRNETTYAASKNGHDPVLDAKKLARQKRNFNRELERILSLELMQEAEQPRPPFKFSLTPWRIQPPRNRIDAGTGHILAMVIFVKSHTKHFQQRIFARKTWVSYERVDDMILRTIFIVGLPSSEDQERQLQEESDTYGDMLQIDIAESYENVVHKTLAGMQWASDVYPADWFYTSTDDDILPDLLKIRGDLWKIIEFEGGSVPYRTSRKADIFRRQEKIAVIAPHLDLPIYCGFGYRVKPRPKRVEESKWFMDENKYPIKTYPPYCFGGWYTMTVKLASELYTLSRRLPVFWIDDIWITGFIRLKYFTSSALKCRNCDSYNTTRGIWTENGGGDVTVFTGEEGELLKKWDDISTELSLHDMEMLI